MKESATALSHEDLASLLERTSRTFALAIPLLDEPLRTDVGAAYLLFRIADTLEDAPRWGRDRRRAALESFAAWVEGGRDRRWIDAVDEQRPDDDAGCLLLLSRADDVRALAALRGDSWEVIRRHVRRTATRMAGFVARQDERGAIELRDLDDLRAYCYAVAGIVGELLTDLFVLQAPSLAGHRDALAARAPHFGEGLQLVNILKDAPSDAREGRAYVPSSVARAEVTELARKDLARAEEYVALLARAGAPAGMRRFCDLPARLAVATLDALARGEAKLAREDVMRIQDAVMRAG
jgi:farnesyl-diphosphate farnesyltransferase